jgi:hypothetical protein
MNIEKLRKRVVEFRDSCEQIRWHSMPCEYRDFPSGTCGDISQILMRVLTKDGYKEIEYVVGMKGKQSHAWLEIQDIALDVTADQFPEIEEAVLFQSPTIWHRTFHIVDRRKSLSSPDSNEIEVSNEINNNLNKIRQ